MTDKPVDAREEARKLGLYEDSSGRIVADLIARVHRQALLGLPTRLLTHTKRGCGGKT